MFRREVSVLQRFAGLGTKFAPRLIEYDDKGLWHETERIPGAEPLCDRLLTLSSNHIDAVVSDLIAIDRLLYVHQIDHRTTSVDHILIGENGEAYLTGFAHSRINHPLQDILFDSALGSLDLESDATGMTRAFSATLAIRRDEVYRLSIRTARRAIQRVFYRRSRRRAEI